MNENILPSICATGFAVAFLHAAIPTHWLPFVLTARVQNWNRAKTLFVTALAGSGHVLFTAILGVLVAWFGSVLSQKIGWWFPWIAGGALILFGLYYVIQQLRGEGHGHSHAFGARSHDAVPHSAAGVRHSHTRGEQEHSHKEHEHSHDEQGHRHTDHEHPHQKHEHWREERKHDKQFAAPPRKSDWAAIASLFALLTFSPCEGFLPVYISGVRYGWIGFFLLTVVLSVATIAGMVVFTWLTLAGIERFKFRTLEKYESGVMGALLCVLGVLVIVFEK